MAVIVDALLPVFVTILLGYFAAWHHDVDSRAASILNRMVMTYTLPLNSFAGAVTASRGEGVSNLPLVGALLAGMAIPYAVVLVAARYVFRRGLGESTLQAMGIAFPAVPFVGSPVLGALFGTEGMAPTVGISGLVANLVILPTSIVLLSSATHPGGDGGVSCGRPRRRTWAGRRTRNGDEASAGSILVGSLKEPVVWAPILGLVLVFAGLGVPESMVRSLQLLGSATSGISLFVSGVILRAHMPTISGAIAVSILSRLVVVPGLALLLLPLAGVSGAVLREAVIALSMPCAITLLILSARYQVAEQENASFRLYTYVFSPVTMAAAIALSG